jgi:hypothetical protein
MDDLLKIREWDEDYRGWRLRFKIRAKTDDGWMKAGVYVQEKSFFGLIAVGGVKYKETGDKWVNGGKTLDEQIETLREGAQGFVDNIESAKDISGERPTSSI